MAEFDLSSITSPLRTSGIDPDDPRAMRLFANLEGGGVGIPTADNPAVARPNPVRPAPTVTPAAVTPSGNPSVKDYGREALQGAVQTMRGAPAINDELAQERALEEKRQQDATYINPRDERGKVLPQYRPSIGQRIFRGVQAVAAGGLPGLAFANYGAPNAQYGRDVERQKAAVAGDDQSLAETRARFKEAHDAATGQGAEWRAIGTLAKDLQENPEKPAPANAGDKLEDTVAARGRIADQLGFKGEQRQRYVATGQVRDDELTPYQRQELALRTREQAFRENQAINKPDKPAAKPAAATFKDAAAIDKYSRKWYDDQRKEVSIAKEREAKLIGVKLIGDNAAEEQRQAKFGEVEKQYAQQAADFEGQKKKWYAALQGGQPVGIDEGGNVIASDTQPTASPAAVTPTGTPAPASKPTPSKGKLTDQNIARQYLQKAGGDKNKARQLARADGYTF